MKKLVATAPRVAELKDYEDREVNASLSGGEIKRVEIASVLARRAKLTVFDEPEAGIDLWSFEGLIEAFQEIKKHLHLLFCAYGYSQIIPDPF